MHHAEQSGNQNHQNQCNSDIAFWLAGPGMPLLNQQRGQQQNGQQSAADYPCRRIAKARRRFNL